MSDADSARPRLLVVAGPNGAGKTTITCSLVDRLYLYDNSVDDRDAQLLVRVAQGRVVRRYAESPAWCAPIVGRLSD